MQLSIIKAKNGEDTAAFENCFLHSSYAPSKEAQRFVDALKLPYTPKAIIITEPALSYVAPLLRKKFENIKLGVIRYSDFFEKYNSNFDFVLNFFEHQDFENYLESSFNEEALLSMYFISWQPSANLFSEENKAVWNGIKKALERAKTLMVTRQYFEKKWFINCSYFFKYLQHPLYLENKISKDCLIISSGPSLKAAISFIKENREKLFIICLSSAISTCLFHQIIPDLCMTTDGGFWAGEHLKKLLKYNIPLAMPSEAFCNKSLLKKNKILPLIYDDGISRELSLASGLNFVHAVRNGTVSGTALSFAAEHCSKNIYMCGLDLAGQKGYQHLQPNELELNNCIKDNRLSTKEKRLTSSEFSSSSLEIYKNWFCTNKLNLGKRKVYRVIEKALRKNNLVWIEDIDENQFKEKLAEVTFEQNENTFFTEVENQSFSKKAFEYFEKNSKNEAWKKQLFPLDYLSLSHNPENTELFKKIENEYNNLINKIRIVLNEQ